MGTTTVIATTEADRLVVEETPPFDPPWNALVLAVLTIAAGCLGVCNLAVVGWLISWDVPARVNQVTWLVGAVAAAGLVAQVWIEDNPEMWERNKRVASESGLTLTIGWALGLLTSVVLGFF